MVIGYGDDIITTELYLGQSGDLISLPVAVFYMVD